MSTKSSLKVSLYIPCFNVSQYIGRCLDAVFAQDYPIDEVLIVDDGSTDSTVEIASKFPVRIIKHCRNLGLAAARNTAIKESKNELVASLDADCIPHPAWLKTLVETMKENTFAGSGGRLIETVLLSSADRWRAAHMAQDWGDERIVNPPFMFGNNSLLRRSAVCHIGGYNESMRTNGEDGDLSRRLSSAGYSFVYLPEAKVGHLRSDTLKSILDTYWRYWKFGSGAHLSEVTLIRVVKSITCSFFGATLIRVILSDLRFGRVNLLWIDLLVPWYLTYRYISYCVVSSKN